jgi:rubrerythrin
MKTSEQDSIGGANMARRSFLRYAGLGVASAGLLATAACHKDHQVIIGGGIDIGAQGDLAILNYAYALEQLEAAFYIQVVANPYAGMTGDEKTFFTSIRDHEVVHREFFKAALSGNAIPALTVDFSTIDFTKKSAVLAAAKAFEDTGVKAYDGAGYLIKDAGYLTIAGKIVSVEARHAAAISNMIAAGSFAADDQVDGNGLNKTATIPEVLKIANTYLKTKVNASNYGYVA